MARAPTLPGLIGDASSRAVTVAGVTGLPAGRLVEAAVGLASSSDLSDWGREVTALLADMARRTARALMDRLAMPGHLAG